MLGANDTLRLGWPPPPQLTFSSRPVVVGVQRNDEELEILVLWPRPGKISYISNRIFISSFARDSNLLTASAAAAAAIPHPQWTHGTGRSLFVF